MDKILDLNSVIPLYHQLKEILVEEIESGKWLPGTMIPSENQLVRIYKISRNTVKKALDDLVIEGKLFRIQGKGTFVSTPKFEQSLSSFYSFSKVMKSQGLEPRDKIVSFNIKKVKSSVARYLNIENNDQVIELKRLRCIKDEPMIFETSYIPYKLVKGLSVEMLEKSSLYELMQNEYGVFVTQAKEAFEPILIRSYEGDLLQVEEGSPGLLLDRIAYDSLGNRVEFCRSIVRGDRCKFYTELL